ncbi:MAG TPA: lysine 5,6-aminomutase subunit alpha [Candidatus Limnocylindrales bacterium]|nr:lysine 5,6-aminomutase subunit alpha [Candidatus Limnocylindrales bacterium]
MSDPRSLEARAHELRDRAGAIAAGFSESADGLTTAACERAVLRLLGVEGLDAVGRPLAHEVVERFAALGPGRIAGGIALPFAAAVLEYDLTPQALALEVAEGHVDLGLESELLQEPERRQSAERAVREWMDAAWHRADANRMATGELREMLREPTPPLVGVDLPTTSAAETATIAASTIRAGADLVRVAVPRDRELTRALGEEVESADAADDPALAPGGSQRGIAHLRHAVDETAAELGRYVSLASRAVGLAAPEQAVVAAFERVDLLFSDPLRAVVELGVEPGRALADHRFAFRIVQRAGTTAVIGASAVAAAPEMARGEPLGATARSGRALALQAIGVALAGEAGLSPERVLVGAAPPDLLVERATLPLGVAEVALRRAVFPGHRLVVDVPEAAEPVAGWPVAVVAWLPGGESPALLMGHAPAGAGLLDRLRDAAAAAGWLDDGRAIGAIRGAVLEQAEAALEAALATLRTLAAEGWEPLLGLPGDAGAAGASRLGAARVYERRDYLDPLR